jgi:hypothetical protein
MWIGLPDDLFDLSTIQIRGELVLGLHILARVSRILVITILEEYSWSASCFYKMNYAAAARHHMLFGATCCHNEAKVSSSRGPTSGTATNISATQSQSMFPFGDVS